MKKTILSIVLGLFILSAIGGLSSWYLWQKKSDVVSCDFEGQLGNNLFQIATATAVALDNNAKAVFPKRKILRNRNGDLNLKYILSRVDSSFIKKKWDTYREKEERIYHPLPYHKNMKLRGYFQSEKYFVHRKKEIQELLSPTDEIVSLINEKYGMLLENKTTVGLHIRTFIPDQRDPENTVDWEYYKKAMSFFDENAIFLVFSDSIDWVKGKFPAWGHKIVFIEDNPHYIDFYLMRECNHQIVSPGSSFSWWAAWLNENPNKKVISTAYWADKGKIYDTVPDSWLKIY